MVRWYSINELPRGNVDKPQLFIINSDESWLPGRHWVCVYIGEECEFFDSIGKGPSYYRNYLEDFLIANSENCTYSYNTKRLQAHGTDTCGKYCIFFCVLKSMGYSFKDILDSFGPDLIENDEFIERYYESGI